MFKWVAKRLKHVSSNTDQTMNTSRWAIVVRMWTSKMFDTAFQPKKKHRTSNTRTKEMFYVVWSKVSLMAFKFLKRDQTRSNSTKHDHQDMLIVFSHRQTFPVCSGLKGYKYTLNIQAMCSHGQCSFNILVSQRPGSTETNQPANILNSKHFTPAYYLLLINQLFTI